MGGNTLIDGKGPLGTGLFTAGEWPGDLSKVPTLGAPELDRGSTIPRADIGGMRET